MKMKTIYEKPEAQFRPSVIRCSILAGSQGQGQGKDVPIDWDARKRQSPLENVSEVEKSEKNAILKF